MNWNFYDSILEQVEKGTMDIDTAVSRLGGEAREVLRREYAPGDACLEDHRVKGQPVLVGGTMGTGSWILAGTQKAEAQTFGSALHGAGRILSRKQAAKQFRSDSIVEELGRPGTLVRGHSRKGIAQEAPGAYKDVDRVVEIMTRAGIVRAVARVRPLICIKG